MNTVEIAALGLQQDSERLRVLSHNVANITTPGYKRQVAVQGAFSELLVAGLAGRAASSIQSDIRAGQLRATGGPLDVALDDREFLTVQTATGESALTRGGALRIDSRGKLTTSAGLPVQGAGGDLSVPTSAGAVRIDSAGQLLADDRLVGSLLVMRLADKAAPLALGGGLFAMPEGAGAQAVQSPRVQTGHTEASNVVSSQEMVQVMETMRHAESMARLIQGADELLEKAIRKLGEM